jgi:hypothetical protein
MSGLYLKIHVANCIPKSKAAHFLTANGKNYRGHRKLQWVPVRTAPKASCAVVSHHATCSNGSGGNHGFEPGKSKIADGGIGVPHQQKGSDLVQKEATLKLCLQSTEDNGSHAENVVMCDGVKRFTENIAKEGTSLNAYLEPNVQTHLKNAAVRPSASYSAHVSADLYAKNCRKFEAHHSLNQQKKISAKDTPFVPKTTVHQYRPRNLGCRIIKSVAPATKPGPQWCPGLTIISTSHNYKQRIEYLFPNLASEW